MLIEAGGNVNLRNNQGRSILALAAQYGNRKIVKLLVSEGADVNDQSPDGETVLGLAVRDKRHSIIEKLMTNEHVDVNIRDTKRNGLTALLTACSNHDSRALSLLLKSNLLSSRTIQQGIRWTSMDPQAKAFKKILVNEHRRRFPASAAKKRTRPEK